MAKVAAIQMASGAQVAANLLKAAELIAIAVAKGATLIVLPENFAFMGKEDEERLNIVEQPEAGEIQAFLSREAKKHQVWILGGTLPLASNSAEKTTASALLFDAEGQQAARYDKIHLFDVSLKNGETYEESKTTQAGDQSIVVETPMGKLGIAICYDLRFPELFRELSEKGAEIFLLPAAFTDSTGKAHWETLVRARAIENLCYVVAAGQGGYHVNTRTTYGHSMIVDYWGRVKDVLPKGEGVVIDDIDLDTMHKTREAFPVLKHRVN
jgi:predicted amidohydrolase